MSLPDEYSTAWILLSCTMILCDKSRPDVSAHRTRWCTSRARPDQEKETCSCARQWQTFLEFVAVLELLVGAREVDGVDGQIVCDHETRYDIIHSSELIQNSSKCGVRHLRARCPGACGQC